MDRGIPAPSPQTDYISNRITPTRITPIDDAGDPALHGIYEDVFCAEVPVLKDRYARERRRSVAQQFAAGGQQPRRKCMSDFVELTAEVDDMTRQFVVKDTGPRQRGGVF